jgi:hypothetical protein
MKHMNTKLLLLLVPFLLVFSGCEDLFEPAIENNRALEEVRGEPRFAQGLLINGYARIPSNSWTFSEMATDDAVANNESNAYSAAATGEWAANNNPLNQWTNSKSAIQYLNLMLQEVDNVKYSETPAVNQMFTDRLKGESFGLRALFMYYLLQAHGGMSGGQLLGIPIVLEPEDVNSDFNQPRATFEACLQQLYADAAEAIGLLPLDYADISNVSQVPAKYTSLQPTRDDYNRVFGNNARLLISGRIVRAVMAQAALLAASPAFNNGNAGAWEDAADYAAAVLDLNGGVGGLAADGETWFANIAQINAVASGVNPPEILWRTDMGLSSNLEDQNFPPTLFGDGLVNPTQNLVDAFPMLNGYPITDVASGYNPMNPYANRDPRLQQSIVVNGSTAGPSNTVINTAADGGTNDGLNKVETSTRTGYYLRKLLRQDVSVNPASVNNQPHIKPRIRYTEIYLIYAEAANEAWGPTGTGSHSYSAYDVIKAIRQRAGIGLGNNDAYLESIKNDQALMRALIRSERRLELSFEGFRFWDLRRWKENLTETAKGVEITGGQHLVIPVESRLFEDHMIYGPIPYSETLKFNALRQNDGW